MQALLYVDLVSGSVSDTLGGAAFSWPKLVQGDDLTLSLRLSQDVGGSAVEVSRVVHGLKATLGRIDTRPADGAIKLKIGSAVTPTIAFNATAQQVADAVNTLGTLTNAQKPVTVTQRDGSYLIGSADGTLLNLAIADNTLWPMSFARLREFEFDGRWIYELRLIQAPVAFINAFARAVPAAPVISEVQQGGSDGTIQWNEVQKLYVPPQFRGDYQIRRGFAKSTLLSTQDGPDEIKAAIASLVDPDGQFNVTNPLPNTAYIEFAGSMAGQSFPLLEIMVVDAPEGDLVINLSLDTEELDTLLRGIAPASGATSPEVTLPFEVEAVVEDENDSNTLRTITLIRADLVVQSELTFEELANYPTIDWLRPPLPRDYVPVTQDQIAVGGQNTRVVLGDGAHTQFVVVHNLNEDGLHITLRENKAGGRQLNAAEDYSVVFDDANSLTITLSSATPPAAGALAIIISTASTRAVFAAHTHTIGQIVGLQAIIDNLGSRVQTLESIVGITEGGTQAAAGTPTIVMTAPLPVSAKLLPWRSNVTPLKFTDLAAADISAVRPLGLLAAVHKATITALPGGAPAPGPSFIGSVYQNQTSSSVQLAGGLGHRGPVLQPGDFAACDGRLWYKVVRYGTEKSFYPADFEQELFTLPIDADQLAVSRTLSLDFALQLAVLGANTNWQWVLELRWAAITADTSPGGVGVNLDAVQWNPTPILSKRLIVTDEPITHTFGLRVARSIVVTSGVAADTLNTTAVLYGNTRGATGPTAAPFVIGGFLCRGDTEDNQSDPRGFAGFVFPTPPNLPTTGSNVGTALIQ